MAKNTYDVALRRCLADEGGYSNLAADPGGPTNFGITIYDYRKYIDPHGTAHDVRTMSVEQAKKIYRARYWDVQRCDALPAGVDYCVFDYGVNSGVGRSGKVLRKLLGYPTNTSVITGEIIAAAAKRDPKQLINAICDERMRFLRSLRTWGDFGKGWARRVAGVRASSLRMAGGGGLVPAPGPVTPVGKGTPTPPSKTTVPVGTGAGVTGIFAWFHDHPLQAVLIAVGVLVVGAVVYAYLNKRYQAKKDNPMPDTPVVPVAAPEAVPEALGATP